MGYDIIRFVTNTDINEDLICNICRGVLEEGLWAPECEHSFCRACITKWLLRRNVCPNDRQYLSHTLLKPIPRFMRNILDKLDIKCDFAANGCPQVIPMELLRQHISVCDFNPEKQIDCVLGCGLVIKKADLDSHNCVKSLRLKMDQLVEENVKSERVVNSVRYELNSLRTENRRFNELITNLQNDVKRLLVDKHMSLTTDDSVSSVPQNTLTTICSATMRTDRNSRVVPNPYVLITPLATPDEPSSSTFTSSTGRLGTDEPPYKRRTTIRVATPLPPNRSMGSLSSTMNSSLITHHSYSQSTHSNVNDTYMRRSPSPIFIPTVTTISPSNDSDSQDDDEDDTNAVSLSDNQNDSYYIDLDHEDNPFNNNDETEPEDDNPSADPTFDIDIISNE